jgi:hypothetical protein
MSKHEIYSRDATVYLVSGKDKFDALHRAIEQSGFVANLLARWSASGKSKQDFLIVIKPNIMTASLHQEDSPVYTDPALVEDLIHIMREQGFANFAVVEAENVYNYSYTGRRVHKVAEPCGYTGNGYRIASMTEEYLVSSMRGSAATASPVMCATPLPITRALSLLPKTSLRWTG